MDCSPERLKNLVQNEEVEFDTDICGPGVLAAFIITSLIALATLILALLTISVPASLQNTGDTMIATGARRTYHRLRAKFTNTRRTSIVQSREERTNAFTGFMIAISDQILISQASILIAALIIRNEITIYSSNIVIALGCLASTVHLGSFPFYMDRMKDHSSAKLIRVLAMAAGSGILVFLLVIQLSYTWDMESHVYFTCTLQDYRVRTGAGADKISITQVFVPLTVLYGTYETVRFLYRHQPVDEKPNEPGARSKSIVSRQNLSGLDDQQPPDNGVIELQRLGTLEHQARTQSNVDFSNIEVERQAIVSLLQLISGSNIEMTTDNETDYRRQRFRLLKSGVIKIEFKEQLSKIKESKREQLLNEWLKLKALTILTSKIVSTGKLRLLARLTAETWAFHQCRGSFAWRLFWLWSGNVYGIVTILTSRAVTTGMSGNPNKMGFGQIVPLTLLALPIFAAMEGRAGYKQKLKSIEKARVDQATFETPVTGNLRSQSRGQSHAQRQNTLAEIDIANIKTVQDALKKRSKDIGYPELYNWVTGDDLTSAPTLQMAVAIHAALMFTIATSLGFSMAYDIANFNITLLTFLIILVARRLIGLNLVESDMSSYPMILDHLGCTGHLPNPLSGSQDKRMAVAQAAGDAGEDLGDRVGEEES
ncbi:uncharacterized protein FPRO_01865 [Fusarium proliferatum ET1]|uniref:Uncharacterized protein n=1 Tax=Fusarium proliferatum (strain ET1) TaxID=1227346 RepID=A0A1L7V1W9_FUSPR|nr:uncharacterized protein FPRO_01865 [Fusarium proliferatum ET1]CZR33105.1 uncharacterized protein FPRO_01865 [Fusarium proliferatum ET1]